MKKNYFFGLFALATMLFTASCQEEDMFGGAQGNTATATFEVSTPMIATRAVGDGTTASELYVAVYENHDGELTGPLAVSLIDEGETVDFTGNVANVNLQLAKNKDYKIIFWAETENNNDAIFNIDWAERQFVLKNELKANQEKYDAFWKTVDVKLTGALTDKVELTRPFAQLNIGTNDKVAAKDAGIVVEQTKVIVTNVPNTFDLVSGKATGDATVTYELAAIADIEGETFPAGTGQSYLSLNYLLIGDKQNTDVTLYYKDADDAAYGVDFTSVPVQRNYRTNIYGALLTNGASYTVELKPGFGDNHNTLVAATAQELSDAFADENVGHIILTDDVNLDDLFGTSNAPAMTRSGATSNSLTLAARRTLDLDLNGYTISGTDKTEKNYGLIQNNGTLTISDSKGEGKLSVKATINSGWNRYSAVISNNPGATLTINGGTIEHLGGTDMAYGVDNLTNGKGTSAVTVVDGATVKSTYSAIRQFLNGVEANNSLTVKSGSVLEGTKRSIFFHDASAAANSGTLVVETGAKLTGDVRLSCTNESVEWPVSVSVPTSTLQGESKVTYVYTPYGYTVEEIDGIWTVVPVAKIGDMNYGTLRNAIAAVLDGETITLIKDETFTADNCSELNGWFEGLYYEGDKSFTIDLNGKTIGNDNEKVNDYLILFRNENDKANVINFKNGTIDAGTSAYCAICTSAGSKQKITINLENINVIGNNSNGGVLKIRGGAELNVNDGTVITGKDSYVGIEAVGNNTVVNIYDGAKIYQNGTTSYVGAIAGASYNATMNIYGGYGESAKCGIIVMSTGATINVSGGEWIANGDGTIAEGNQAVLVSQNNREEKNWACKSVLNVTGGTFKGGYNCYGMGTGAEADDGQINITGGNFNADPTTYLEYGYIIKEGTEYEVVMNPVAKIGDTEYPTLQAAFDNINDGETITLVEDITIESGATTTTNGYVDGVMYTGDKSFTIDFNGKTVTDDGCINDYLIYVNNKGSKANEITFKNGTMTVSKAAWSALAVNSNSSTNACVVNLNGMTVNMGNPDGWSNDVLRARKNGTLNLNNGTTINSNGTAYGATAQTGGVLNINSGAKVVHKNSGTSGGNYPYTAVSGNGIINVYDGAEITSDLYGIHNMTTGNTVVNIYGGSITAPVALHASTNGGAGESAYFYVKGGNINGGLETYSDNGHIVVSGGTFTADPTAYLAEGYKVKEGTTYEVVVDPAATINGTEYATLQEAFNAGGEITLLRDVKLSETVVLEEGKTVVLDLNSKTISAVDKNTIKNNGGILTIENGTVTRTGDAVGYSVNNASGEITVIDATIQRGLYTSGSKMVATNANISHEQSSRHAIYAWDCEVTINSGTFHNDNSGNATLMASGTSVVTINGGTFSIADGRVEGNNNTWTSSMIDQNKTSQVIVKGGTFNGGFRINSVDTKLTIEGGEFNTNNGSGYTDYSGTKVVKGGKFTDEGAQTWAKKYLASGYTMNDNGEVVVK